MKNKYKDQIVVVDTSEKWEELENYISNYLHGHYIVVRDGNYSKDELEQLVKDCVNRHLWIIIVENGISVHYSYEVNYKSVFDKERNGYVYNYEKTVKYHINNLIRHIEEDVDEFRRYLNGEDIKRGDRTMTVDEIEKIRTIRTNGKTIKSAFLFGFEELRIRFFDSSKEDMVIDRKEFAEGGKFEKFLTYTIKRFEDEFYGTVSFS